MGGKPRQRKKRQKRLRVSFSQGDAKEIYTQICKQFVGYGAVRDFVQKIGAWVDEQEKEQNEQRESNSSDPTR